jgi:acyl-CoA synthetase (AMP-forming)/AMP-acid ligase II
VALLLPDVAAEAARRFGSRTAFADGSSTLSYADLDRLSDEVAAGMARRGVVAGDVVALVLPTVIEYPVCYLAAAKLGAVTAGVNTRLAAAQRDGLLGRVTPALTVVGDGGIAAPTGETVAVSPGSTIDSMLSELRLAAAPPARPPAHPDRPVAIVFTSGTTGTPKGAVFGERQLDAIRRIDAGDTWGAGGAVLLGTSLSHLGFMTKLPGALQSGRTNHLLRTWHAADAIRMTAQLRLTSLSGVPTQLALMLADPALDAADLSALRLALIGGGPATPDLVRSARERLGVPVCTRYSCTEAGIGCGTHPADPPEDAETTVGRPQPGVELVIRGPAGDGMPPGETGEVLLRSAAVMSGYWRDPDATAESLSADGYVRTGDLGFIDERGRLHLAGRSSERYVRGGYNVSPATVEAVLAGHPDVRDVAVVPVADDVMGEIGVAIVVPRAQPPTLAALRSYGEPSLAKHELPERLVVVDALPLTAGDKIDRAALTRLAVTSSSHRVLHSGP